MNCLDRDGGREIETEDGARLLYATQLTAFPSRRVNFHLGVYSFSNRTYCLSIPPETYADCENMPLSEYVPALSLAVVES